MKITCPCCQGSGEIEEMSPVYLPPLQYRVWDIVRRAGAGIPMATLVDKVYADRVNGGPTHGKTSVYVSIYHLNQRLKETGQRISIRGSVCRLETTQPVRNG